MKDLPAKIKESDLLGAKALHGLKCKCGGTATGMSGWVGNLLKLKIQCGKCEEVFYIEKDFPATTLQIDCKDLQTQAENEWLHIWRYGPPKEVKKLKPAEVIEIDFGGGEKKLIEVFKGVNISIGSSKSGHQAGFNVPNMEECMLGEDFKELHDTIIKRLPHVFEASPCEYIESDLGKGLKELQDVNAYMQQRVTDLTSIPVTPSTDVDFTNVKLEAIKKEAEDRRLKRIWKKLSYLFRLNK